MAEVRVRSYYRSVLARGGRDALAAATQGGLLMGGAVGVVGGLIEAGLNADADLPSIVASAVLAVLLMSAVVFAANLVAAPVRLARESAKSLSEAEGERDEVQRRLAGRSSREQLADHLDEFGREVELLRTEVPESENDHYQVALWEQVFGDFSVRVQAQLRRHAPEWLEAWKDTPGALRIAPVRERAEGLLELSTEQLAQISAGLRAGTPPPASSTTPSSTE